MLVFFALFPIEIWFIQVMLDLVKHMSQLKVDYSLDRFLTNFDENCVINLFKYGVVKGVKSFIASTLENVG